MSSPRLIASGCWAVGGSVTMTDAVENPQAEAAAAWKVGQIVEVQPRTWAGINRPGGHGKICRIHYKNNDENRGVVESLDVKYTIASGCDTFLDPDLVKPYQELNPRGRSRRSRALYEPSEEVTEKGAGKKKKNHAPSKRPPLAKSKPQDKENNDQLCQQPKKTEKRRRKVFAKKHAVAPARMRFHTAQKKEPSLGDDIPNEITVPIKTKGSATPIVRISPLGAGFSNTQLRKRPESPALPSAFDQSKSLETKFRVASDQDTTEEMQSEAAIPRTTQLATGHVTDMDVDTAVNESGAIQEGSVPGNSASGPHGVYPQPRVHLTLEKVYSDERRNAAKFIDNVVTGRGAAAEAMEQQADVEMKVPSADPLVDERRNMFQKLLNHILMVNESMVEQNGIMDLVNKLCMQRGNEMQFTADETKQFLKNLAEENKVMLTDGLVLGI